MKNIAFLGLLVLSLQTVYSNPIWTRVLDNQPFNKSSVIDMALGNDSQILITGHTETFGCATSRLFAINAQGELLWDQGTPEKYNMGGSFDLVHARDGFIYTAGFLYADDTYYGTEPLVISKLHADGTIEYSNLYRGDAWQEYFMFTPVSMDVSPAGKVVISGGIAPDFNTVVWVDTNGDVVWEKEYDFFVEQVSFLNDESIVIRSNGNLYLTDMDGDIVETYLPDNLVVDMIMHDSFIYLLYASGLEKTDPDFESVEVLLEDEPAELERIKVFDDAIWIMGKENNQIVMIQPEAAKEESHLSFGSYVANVDFVVAGNQIIFAGTSPSGQIGLYAFLSGEQNDADYLWPDIELLDFGIDNVVVNYEDFGGEPIATSFDFDATLTIRNNGLEPVHALSVFSLRSGGVNCAKQFFYENYADFNIMPGEEIILEVGSSNEYAPPTSSNELCFEILAPDSRLEFNTESNFLCKTFFITNVSEYQPHELVVYPNPVKDWLYISALKEASFGYTITDMAGRIMVKSEHDGSTAGIDVSSLAPGIYILRMVEQNMIRSSKFVKE